MTEPTSAAGPVPSLLPGAGFSDRASNGRLWITGADALDLLNRLTTNQLEELSAGHGTSTVLTNGDGRVIDLLHLGAQDDGLWCVTSPGLAETVVDWLDTYTFGEEITVVDRTADTFHLAVVGPGAREALIAVGAAVKELEADRLCGSSIAGVLVLVWRKLAGGADGYELIGAREDAPAVTGALESVGVASISEHDWEAYRIANGMPVAGAEFGTFNNPLEAGLLGSISETKGCYTGQEVIARLQTYRKVQRRLMTVELAGPADVGARLLADGTNAGRLTSVAEADGRVLGLALVSAKQAEAGAVLEAVADGQPTVRATLRDPSYVLLTEPDEPLTN